MKTEEGDFEIAKFMGCVYPNMQNEVWGLNWPDLHGYHRSWDLLMPVVEKIESLADQETGHMEVQIRGYHCAIYQYDYKEKFKCHDGRLNKIQAVWQTVIQFIQWYNKTKSQ